MREGILYRSLPPDELIRTALSRRDLKDAPFLAPLRETDFSSEDFGAAFHGSLAPLPLSDEERGVLSDFSETLGKSDRESQLFACDEALCRLNELCKKASEEAKKQSRMWTSLGALGGAFAVILLI